MRCASAVRPARMRARLRTYIPPKGACNDFPRPLQGRRPLPGRVRPQGDRAGRARDARAHGHAGRVRRLPAPGRRPRHRLPAHDDPDGRADRDPHRARGPGALVQLQHLLHPGPRGGRRGRRAEGHSRGPAGRARLRLEGRDPRGVLVVHRAGPAVARRGRPQHDPRRRRRRHAPRAQGRRVREGRQRAGPLHRRLGGVRGRPDRAGAQPGRGPGPLDVDRQRDQGRDRGDHDRRAPPGRHGPEGRAPLPRHQRQRLGHQVEVRQQVRLPPLAGRRDQPGHRRPHRRQGRRRLRLRRRRQGLRPVAGRPGRPRRGHRGRPDLRAAGGHGGLPGHHARGHPARRPTSSSRRPATRTSSPPSTWRA